MGDSMEKKINDFIVFCIEVFKEENKLTGKEVYELFEKYGHKFIVIRYHEILGAYDTLESAINVTSQSHQLGTFIVQDKKHMNCLRSMEY